MRSFFLSLAGILGLTGVALGAFGAHALQPRLEELNTMTVWNTGVSYHLIHTLGILIVAAVLFSGSSEKWARWICLAWTFGILLFSGSLYLLALGGPGFLGPFTPLGGFLFLLGWLFLVPAARNL